MLIKLYIIKNKLLTHVEMCQNLTSQFEYHLTLEFHIVTSAIQGNVLPTLPL